MSQSVGGMSADEVHRVLGALGAPGCRVWISGGWGVDALVGRQTRVHRDLDLGFDAAVETKVFAEMSQLGYTVETDRRPVRVELAAPGNRWVDLHPVTFDGEGNGVQADLGGGFFWYPAACFVTGTIAGRIVDCISVEQQLAFHHGYNPRPIDRADLALLVDPRGTRPATPD